MELHKMISLSDFQAQSGDDALTPTVLFKGVECCCKHSYSWSYCFFALDGSTCWEGNTCAGYYNCINMEISGDDQTGGYETCELANPGIMTGLITSAVFAGAFLLLSMFLCLLVKKYERKLLIATEGHQSSAAVYPATSPSPSPSPQRASAETMGTVASQGLKFASNFDPTGITGLVSSALDTGMAVKTATTKAPVVVVAPTASAKIPVKVKAADVGRFAESNDIRLFDVEII
jgi:hypothetical protein